MARKSPVAIWTIRQRESKEPKFHKIEIFAGAGRSTRAPFAILSKG